MADNRMTTEQIRRIGLEALLRELGPEGMVRFLQQFETGSGDYTEDRGRLMPNLSVDEIVREIAARRGGQDGNHP